MTQHTGRDLSRYISHLRLSAVTERDVPPAIAERAAGATARALLGAADDHRGRARARAYFWAVVRRGLLRSGEGRDASARFVLSTVARELSDAGWPPQRVWDELVRGWGDRVPVRVLDEYREGLCA